MEEKKLNKSKFRIAEFNSWNWDAFFRTGEYLIKNRLLWVYLFYIILWLSVFIPIIQFMVNGKSSIEITEFLGCLLALFISKTAVGFCAEHRAKNEK